MTSSFRFPILSVDELIMWLRVELELQDLNITDDDFKNPQPHRVQMIYRMILEREMDMHQERIIQPNFEAAQELAHAECFEESIPLINLVRLMARFMTACDVNDFKLKDLTSPKPKRTMRMLSGIANFCRFKKVRIEAYEGIKADVDNIKEQHSHYLRRNDELKTKINNIKASRAEKEVFIQEMSAKVDELGNIMSGYKQDQATLQPEIHQIKTSCSEKTAKLEQVKVNILNSREAGTKLRPQIIQSPERIKTDMTRMHNAIATDKKAKEDKGRRSMELNGQKENILQRCDIAEQGVKILNGIYGELDKQKEVKGEVEKVRDHTLGQKDALGDLAAQEDQLKLQLQSKQEKLAKYQLQQKHKQEAKKGTVTAKESCSVKQQKLMAQLSAFEDKKAQIQQQVADARSIHEDKMEAASAKYSAMLQSLDMYHRNLAEAFEVANPAKVLA